MDEWYSWAISTPQGQFVVGVLILIFGSKAVLSEESLKGKLSGLALPGRWFRRRQQKAAEREVSEIKLLREQTARQHRYIVEVTQQIRVWEIDAADRGHDFPPPKFETFSEWSTRIYGSEPADN